MQCNTSDGTCLFDYVDPTATVTSISSSFNDSDNTMKVTVTGSGLDSDPATTYLVIDGITQQTDSATSTQADFTITDILGMRSSDVGFFTEIGAPSGASSISSITFTPKLVSISPSTGSAGGEKLTVTGVGFGLNDSVNLYHQESTQNLCSSTEVTGYGTFICYTISQEVASTDTIKLVVYNANYDCGNTISAADCTYEASIASSPEVTGISVSSPSEIVFSGTSLDDTDSVVATLNGVESTSCTATGTQVTCVFGDLGIPVSNDEIATSLVFTTGGLESTAYNT